MSSRRSEAIETLELVVAIEKLVRLIIEDQTFEGESQQAVASADLDGLRDALVIALESWGGRFPA